MNEKNIVSKEIFELETDEETAYPLKYKNKSEKLIVQEEKQTICKCFREYSASTSIHGVQYLGEANRPVWERLFWIVVFIISIYTCSHMIFKLWRKWNDTPVIVSFDERETEMWKIPFPSVTICPQIKSNAELFSFEKNSKKPFQNYTEKEKLYARALLNVCDIDPFLEGNPFDNNTKDYDIIKTLGHVFPDFDINFTFENVEQNYSLVVTEEGICYNFNGLGIRNMLKEECQTPDLDNQAETRLDWNREDGYRKNAGIRAYPRRVLGSGIKLGLEIVLYSQKTDVDNLCSLPADGYKILIHSPDNIPLVSSKFFTLPTNQHVIAAVKPNMMWTSDELRNYSPEKRQCFFNKERILKYFQVYTEVNCRLECLTDYTFSICGCVQFSMPRLSSMRVCQNTNETECFKVAENQFSTSEIETEYSERQNAKTIKEDCNCRPPCTTVEYGIETSQSSFDFSNLGKALFSDEEMQIELQMTVPSKLTVFFKENSFLTSKRSELYGMSEFVANCGGLLGLFMGVSALSFVEIFYFSALRLLTNNFRRKNRHD